MHDVLICAASDWIGSARVPRLLHEAGCTVTFFGDPGAFVARSRYVSARIAAPADAQACASSLRAYLEAHAGRYRWILILDDPLLCEVATHAGASWLDGWFPFDHRSDALACAISKNEFIRRAAEVGLPTPRFAICDDFASATSAARALGYPVMLKLDRGAGGRAVWEASDESELRTVCDGRPDARPFMLQEFINGPVGVAEALYDRGRLLCYQSSAKPERFPTPFSPSCSRRACYPPKIEEALIAVGRLCGVHGFGGFDWILDVRDQTFKIIEFHARATSGLHLSLRVGDMFSAAIAGMLNGDVPSTPRRVPEENITVKLFPQYLQKALSRRDARNSLSWLPFLDRSWDTPWDDPPLMWAFAEHVCRRALGAAKRPKVRNRPRANALRVTTRGLSPDQEKNGDARREKGVVAVSTDSPSFTPNLTVGEAFALHPGARAVFANFHLGGCSNCAISEFETIDQVSEGYGIPLSMIMDALNALPPMQTPEPAQKAS